MAIFRGAHASDADWESAARSCLIQLDTGSHRSDLGFIYVTDQLASDLGEIVHFMRLRTGIESWVGSVGAGICGAGVEYHAEPALTVLVASLPAGSFRVFSGLHESLAGFDAEHGAWCREASPWFGVVHGDPRNGAIGDLVERLSERMGSGFLVGGLSSASRHHFQVANEITEGGLSGVLLDSRVAVATRLTQGCRPIGGRHRVTSCEANVCLTLDDRPAADVLFEAAGDLVARNPQLIAGYIFAGLPVRGSDTGDYVVRHIVALDRESGAMMIDAPLEPGGAVLFCRRDGEAAVADLHRVAAQARQGLASEPRGALYFTCVARGPGLFGELHAELRHIGEEIGETPLAGFFGNGEISSNRLYGYTGVLTLFA